MKADWVCFIIIHYIYCCNSWKWSFIAESFVRGRTMIWLLEQSNIQITYANHPCSTTILLKREKKDKKWSDFLSWTLNQDWWRWSLIIFDNKAFLCQKKLWSSGGAYQIVANFFRLPRWIIVSVLTLYGRSLVRSPAGYKKTLQLVLLLLRYKRSIRDKEQRLVGSESE